VSERKRVVVTPGERVKTVGPYSEIMLYLDLAGRPIEVELLRNDHPGGVYYAAQIYVNGAPRSAPVAYFEAGFRYDPGTREFSVDADDGPGDADPRRVANDTTRAITAAIGDDVRVVDDLGLTF